MFDKIMIDIETFGVSSNSVILSIGAVEFNNQVLGKTFHQAISVESCTAAGLQIDARTVLWWLEQSDAARHSLLNRDIAPLGLALQAFSSEFDWKGKEVWCNGASFDFPILDHAFKAIGSRAPWAYYNTRDMRTLKNLVPQEVCERCKVEPSVKHDALADAIAQAETTIALLQYLNVCFDAKQRVDNYPCQKKGAEK